MVALGASLKWHIGSEVGVSELATARRRRCALMVTTRVAVLVAFLTVAHQVSEAQGKDRSYRSYSVDMHDRSVEINGELDADDRRHLRAKNFACVDILSRGDMNTLGPMRLMRHIESLLLDSNLKSHHLSNALRNYPDLRELAIKQDVALDAESVKLLGDFRELDSLELQVAVADVPALSDLPKSLKKLTLTGPAVCCNKEFHVQLENLLELNLDRDEICADFFGRLKIPKVHSVNFVGAKINTGVLSSLSNLPDLKSVYIYNCTYDPSDLAQLRAAKPSLYVYEPYKYSRSTK
jgi:hypothetical protein